MQQAHSTDYPLEMPTRLIVPGVLTLNTVRWGAEGAFVEGQVGDDAFEITVPTADLLDRKRFSFAVWRYRHLLAILPTIEVWREAIRRAEGGAE